MLSIIITAYKEEKTIAKAIQSILDNNLKIQYEILIVAPDKETLEVAREYSGKDSKIKVIKDKNKGKPAALNLALSHTKGKILVLTDGDVYIEKDSLKYLLEPFKNESIGAVSGHPISINSKNNMFGYWAHVLTNIANERRLIALENKKRFFCSGYLFAIRKELFPKLQEDLLSEDGFISHNVYENNFKIDYSEKSKVYVKYPTNFSDWIKQKERSAGGYNQIKMLLGKEIRSFKTESQGGFGLLKYITSFREFFWMSLLFIARLYLWIIIYIKINLGKEKLYKEKGWQRIESTK
ncbi:MAG: glycosyltransferase family 2 protein [Candidatus Pacearchaeota archaeon]|nr:glycosyltransferase family 2 protein [Candidatus Pacearchaeota archaeon]